MSSIPVGTVECRDPKVCGGARFHYASTASACGATKSPMRAPANFATVPPSQKADPSCRVHGIEPGGEYAVQALDGRKVAAGALGVGTILGLCSCSTDTNATDPTGGPTTSIEQTVSPSATESPADVVVRTATEDDWAAYSDGYVPSDEPQGAGEQFIFDTYPDLWAQGVRALSNKMMAGYNLTDPAVPGALVQYIDGERFEGTISMPLGFRGQTTAPGTLPSDVVANRITALATGEWPDGNVGQGGYTIQILENSGLERRPGRDITQANDTQLIVSQFDKHDQMKQMGEIMRFADWQTAWAYAQSNGYSVPGMERPLFPGEVATITVSREVIDAQNWNNGSTYWVWDSSSNDWVLAVDQTSRP